MEGTHLSQWIPGVCEDLETSAEILWCEIHNGNVWCALFGVYYRPPSTGSDYLEALSESLSVVSQQGIGTVMLLRRTKAKLSLQATLHLHVCYDHVFPWYNLMGATHCPILNHPAMFLWLLWYHSNWYHPKPWTQMSCSQHCPSLLYSWALTPAHFMCHHLLQLSQHSPLWLDATGLSHQRCATDLRNDQ